MGIEPRMAVGEVIASCEIRHVAIRGAGRHHHYVAVLRDQLGNMWICDDIHERADEAQGCAAEELWRRIESGEVSRRSRKPPR